ncbi:MAG: 1-acyl-sn-glycerol-3-phosphate acyltransferase [Ardenticatenaceae bacterium]|nr:1-acyl-sn-glycerol-3-phosphate acyltransferase [Ardenticatenaceae bacterium]HBY99217.1 hypothetical protein [Chloroflexota bacterium]
MTERSVLPSSTVVYSMLRTLVRGILRLIVRVHAEGMENIPRDESLLLCINHLHLFDPPVVMAFMPQTVSVMVASKYAPLHNPIGWILRLVDVVFVNRGEVDRQALKGVLERLKAGRTVGVAPEGTRSRTGMLQPGKEGAAYIALKSGVRVLPVAIWGVEQILPALTRLRRAEVNIRFGEPFGLEVDPSLTRGAQLEQGTRQIMLALARMLPPAYRGVYAAAVAGEEPSASAADQPTPA